MLDKIKEKITNKRDYQKQAAVCQRHNELMLLTSNSNWSGSINKMMNTLRYLNKTKMQTMSDKVHWRLNQIFERACI